MHYKGFIDLLIKYEDINVRKSDPEQPFSVNILSGEGRVDLK